MWCCGIYTKDRSRLAILGRSTCAQHSAKVVVIYFVLVHIDKVPPLLLASLALHLILINRTLEVEVGELLVEVLEDLIVELGQAQFRAWELLEDGPVCTHVLNDCHSISFSPSPTLRLFCHTLYCKLLLNLLVVVGIFGLEGNTARSCEGHFERFTAVTEPVVLSCYVVQKIAISGRELQIEDVRAGMKQV